MVSSSCHDVTILALLYAMESHLIVSRCLLLFLGFPPLRLRSAALNSLFVTTVLGVSIWLWLPTPFSVSLTPFQHNGASRGLDRG